MIALLLALSLAAPPLPVRVVLLGEFTPAEQAEALGRVERGAAFWSERAPEPIHAEVSQGATLAAPADLEAWLADLPVHEVATVYVVRGAALPGGGVGAASHAHRFALVAYDAPFAEAVAAHELGHMVYGLHHACPHDGADMMCGFVGAYRLGRLGCGTLAQLGGACWRVGLPIVGGGVYEG